MHIFALIIFSFGVIQIKNKIKSLPSPITKSFPQFLLEVLYFQIYSLGFIHFELNFTHDVRCFSSMHVEYPASPHQLLKNQPTPACILGSIVKRSISYDCTGLFPGSLLYWSVCIFCANIILLRLTPVL